MKILAFTAGAAKMYCGSCLRDNALAADGVRQHYGVSPMAERTLEAYGKIAAVVDHA
jgi:hypothetical protein